MKTNILSHFVAILLFSIYAITASAQYDKSGDDDKKCNRFRIGAKFLIPNIAGLTVEFVPPFANNRLTLVADYTRFGLPRLLTQALDLDVDVKASISYLAIGPNFYLNNKGRAGGAYLGLRYQQFSVKTSVEADNSANAKGTQKALAALFGVSSGGHFWAGFEIGGGMPLGPATGQYVEVVNGNRTVEAYQESIIPFVPIFNFKLGASF